MSGPALRAVVVGAGLAGLAAAHRLQRCGVRVVALEARARAGGSLAPERLGETELDLPRALARSAPQLRRLADELGLGGRLVREPLSHALVPGRAGPRRIGLGMREALRGQPLGGLRLARLQAVAEWLGARVDPAWPERETRLDDRSVTDLCQLYLGRRACRTQIAPLLECAFGLDARETSRDLFFAWLGAGADVELSRASGLGALCARLAGALDDLRCSTRAAAVLEGGRGVRLVSGERLEADALVLAVGPQEVLRLVGELGHVEREILAGCRSSRQHWLALAMEPGPRLLAPLGWSSELAALWDASLPAEGAGSLVLVRAHGECDAQALRARAEELVPELARRVRAVHAFERAVPEFGVGHFRRVARLFAEAERRPELRIWLCGDYLVGPDAEAMAASGERAAEAVLARLRAPRAQPA